MSRILLLLAVTSLAQAAPEAEAPADAEPADASYQAYVASPMEIQYGVCVQCHGAHGEGRPELGAPRIGDLDPSYLQLQLTAFHLGQRGSHPDDTAAHPMAAIGQGLPVSLHPRLAAFAAELHPSPEPPGEAVRGGAAAYATCATCHGSRAEGDVGKGAPALAQQHPSYLKRQLQSYRDGRRGGPSSTAMAQQMAEQAAGLSDDDIDTLVAHIASLRPPLPPVEDQPVTEGREAGLAAFDDIYAVLTHPRCMNCHPAGDAPLQGEDARPHSHGITRFSPLQGIHCSQCHAPAGIRDGQAPLPPADPLWSMPPRAMAFQDRTPSELCAQLTDRSVNGGRGLVSLTEHVEADHLLITSWHSGRPAPPLSHPDLVARFETWSAAGGPCPESE